MKGKFDFDCKKERMEFIKSKKKKSKDKDKKTNFAQDLMSKVIPTAQAATVEKLPTEAETLKMQAKAYKPTMRTAKTGFGRSIDVITDPLAIRRRAIRMSAILSS